MSTSKFDTSGRLLQSLNLASPSTELNLPPNAVQFRRNGIEFRCSQPIPIWTEMTVGLQSPGSMRKMSCTGVVVQCNGNRHGGYRISMLLLNLSRQSQERLSKLAAREGA
jgi:hypothetical protein